MKYWKRILLSLVILVSLLRSSFAATIILQEDTQSWQANTPYKSPTVSHPDGILTAYGDSFGNQYDLLATGFPALNEFNANLCVKPDARCQQLLDTDFFGGIIEWTCNTGAGLSGETSNLHDIQVSLDRTVGVYVNYYTTTTTQNVIILMNIVQDFISKPNTYCAEMEHYILREGYWPTYIDMDVEGRAVAFTDKEGNYYVAIRNTTDGSWNDPVAVRQNLTTYSNPSLHIVDDSLYLLIPQEVSAAGSVPHMYSYSSNTNSFINVFTPSEGVPLDENLTCSHGEDFQKNQTKAICRGVSTCHLVDLINFIEVVEFNCTEARVAISPDGDRILYIADHSTDFKIFMRRAENGWVEEPLYGTTEFPGNYGELYSVNWITQDTALIHKRDNLWVTIELVTPPSPSPTPFPSPSPTPFPSPSPSPLPSPSPTPSPVPSPSPTMTPSPTPIPIDIPAPEAIPSRSPSPSPRNVTSEEIIAEVLELYSAALQKDMLNQSSAPASSLTKDEAEALLQATSTLLEFGGNFSTAVEILNYASLAEVYSPEIAFGALDNLAIVMAAADDYIVDNEDEEEEQVDEMQAQGALFNELSKILDNVQESIVSQLSFCGTTLSFNGTQLRYYAFTATGEECNTGLVQVPINPFQTSSTGSSYFQLPAGFGNEVAKALTAQQTDSVSYTTSQLNCIAINRHVWVGQCSANNVLASNLEGLTVRVRVNDGTAGEVHMHGLPNPILLHFPSTEETRNGADEFEPQDEQVVRSHQFRLLLASEGDPVQCAFITQGCSLSTQGCSLLESNVSGVYCHCNHLSNFAKVFGNTEDWSIWRILSISLLLAVWLIIIILFAFVYVLDRTENETLQNVSVVFHFEKTEQKNERIWGRHSSTIPPENAE